MITAKKKTLYCGRYKFNGLYNPRAADFVDDGGVPDPSSFMEACCVRLERMFPDVPHVANLVREMRAFAGHKSVAEFPELDWPMMDRFSVAGVVPAAFDSTIPE